MSFFDLIRAAMVYIKEKDRIERDKLIELVEGRYRKQIRRAYRLVPLYKRLYSGIDIYKLKNLEDFKRLPFLDKNDLISASKDDLIPLRSRNLTMVSTSGTTGKPVSIYVSFPEMVHGLVGYLRSLEEYDLNWKKARIAIIADLREGSAESGYLFKSVFAQRLLRFDNLLILDTNKEPRDIMNKLVDFRPDFLGGYAGMLSHLALLKEKKREKVDPDVIASTGSPLDKNLRRYIEESFDAELFEVYGATESGPIAFDCRYGSMHVNEDMVHVEILEGKNTGHLIVTKLYGEGTPVIRYRGVDDIISLSKKSCKCGRKGVIINRIYGRGNLSIYRRDGAVLTPSVFAEIFSPVIYELKSERLRATKIIQHSLNKVEIRVVLDDKLRDVSDKEILEIIERGFIKKMGESLNIEVKKVKKISRKKPTVLSRIDPNIFKKLKYI